MPRPRANATVGLDDLVLLGEDSASPSESERDEPLLVEIRDDQLEEDGISLSELPTFAVRLLSGGNSMDQLPQVWSADAAAAVWRLQRLSIFILTVLSFSFSLAVFSFVRTAIAWESSDDKHCAAPIRWWLLGHFAILAAGLIGCLTIAIPACIPWIAWGTMLLVRKDIKTCESKLVNATSEAVSAEVILLSSAGFTCCLALSAAMAAKRALSLSVEEDEAWEPEIHLKFEEVECLLQQEMEQSDSSDQCGDRDEHRSQGSSVDRECVICYGPLTSVGDVIATAVCGHRFHKDCMLAWLRNHRTCPLCRHRVDKPLRSLPGREQPLSSVTLQDAVELLGETRSLV